MEKKAERLKRMKIFKDFGNEEILKVARVAMEKIYPAGGVIIKEGEVGEGLFSIVDGEVEIRKRMPGGQTEKSLAVLKEGDHFGEMGLIDGKSASASVVAIRPTICFVVKRNDYHDLLGKEPIIAMKLYRYYTTTLCERLRRTDAFLLEEIMKNRRKVDPEVLSPSASL